MAEKVTGNQRSERGTMKKEELIEELQDLEWEDFEVKEAVSEIPKSSWETVSAFSNTSGGWLVFGVRKIGKQYEVLGIKNPEKIEQDFTTALRSDKFNQKITPQMKKYMLDKHMVLAFYIPVSERKPVFFNSISNTFIRTGSGDQRATKEEVDSLLRQAAFVSKDKELTSYTLNHLDSKTIIDFKRYLKEVNPEHAYNQLSTKKLLQKLQVIVDGKITVGGLLVFGKQDTLHTLLTDFRVDYLEIPGTSYADATTRYTFRLSEEENLFRFYFSIISRLIKKIDIPFKMRSDGLATDNQPQVIAIREALVNLLMHSDYFSTMKPRIRVFTDRIEFMNPGSLPKPVEVIMKEDFTQPKNPIIARIFRCIKLSENAGSGFEKMFVGWTSCYKQNPIVHNELDYYKITFYLELSEKYKKEEGVGSGQKSGQKSGQILSGRLQEILNLIIEKPSISREQLAEKLGINQSAVQKHIQKLKESGNLHRIGPDKGGHWEVKKR